MRTRKRRPGNGVCMAVNRLLEIGYRVILVFGTDLFRGWKRPRSGKAGVTNIMIALAKRDYPTPFG